MKIYVVFKIAIIVLLLGVLFSCKEKEEVVYQISYGSGKTEKIYVKSNEKYKVYLEIIDKDSIIKKSTVDKEAYNEILEMVQTEISMDTEPDQYVYVTLDFWLVYKVEYPDRFYTTSYKGVLNSPNLSRFKHIVKQISTKE
ncbi:MAG TPA: hypothetical protein VLZ11_00045 [Flavobacterium sp.]|nr:hypothetical protein [Flavobacterium sp.]